MKYRAQAKVDKTLLFDVLYQSAIAIATAHQHGVFHCDIKPKNMLYNGRTLKLIDFDISSKMDSDSFINKYRFRMTSKLPGCTLQFCPPEVQYYESIKGQLPITPGKIDAFCWGMSMLQFLTGMSDAELEERTWKIKNSYKDCYDFVEKIKTINISQLGEKASACVMKLIARCLEYSPCMRLNMEDVLACLVCPNEEFSELINSLSKPIANQYSGEIHKLIAQSNMLQSIPPKEKISEETKILPKLKILPDLKKVPDKMDTILESALKKINIFLSSKDISTNVLYQKIVNTKDKELYLRNNNII